MIGRVAEVRQGRAGLQKKGVWGLILSGEELSSQMQRAGISVGTSVWGS